MAGIQRTWSKYKSSINGPVRTRMDLYKNQPSEKVHSYGILKKVRGEESYDEVFTSGLQAQMIFDLPEFSIYEDIWFILDITTDDFNDKYGDIDSINARIADKDTKINAVLVHKSKNILSGKIQIDSDFSHQYNSNSKYDAFSLSSLMNGVGESKSKIKRIIKPVGISKFKTAVEIADGSIKLAASGRNFFQIDENGISLNSSSINMQCMPNAIRYGGFISPQSPFLGLIPSTTTSPVSQYTINLPIEGIASLGEIASILGSILGT